MTQELRWQGLSDEWQVIGHCYTGSAPRSGLGARGSARRRRASPGQSDPSRRGAMTLPRRPPPFRWPTPSRSSNPATGSSPTPTRPSSVRAGAGAALQAVWCISSGDLPTWQRYLRRSSSLPERGADQSIWSPRARQKTGSAILRTPSSSASLDLPERESGSARTTMSHLRDTLCFTIRPASVANRS